MGDRGAENPQDQVIIARPNRPIPGHIFLSYPIRPVVLSDLDSEQVRTIMERLKRTGRLKLGDKSEQQHELFQ